MIQIADNFGYQGPKPNFARDYYTTKTKLKAVTDNDIDDGHIAYCAETGLHYEYKSTNSVDDNIGKWREYKPLDIELKADSENGVQNKVIKAAVDDLVSKFNTLKDSLDNVSDLIEMDSELSDDSERGVQNKVLKAQFDAIGAQIATLENAAKDYVKKGDVQTEVNTSENPVSSKAVNTAKEALESSISNINTQITNLTKRVDNVEPVDTALNATSTKPVQNKAIFAKFQEVDDKLAEVQENLDGLNYGSYNFCVAAWKKDDLAPKAIEQWGDPDLLRRWDFYLVDHENVTEDGKACIPEAKLRRNNLFRDQYGRYVKSVFTNLKCKGLYDVQGNQNDGYTAKSAFNQDSNLLYTNAACTGESYATAATFDPGKFWDEFGKDGRLWFKDAGGSIHELSNLPRPWEEYQADSKGFETCKSVVMSYPQKCYLLDQIEGNSGKIWKGIFFEPTTWDGIDVSPYFLEPTGIGPTPSTAYAPSGTSSTTKVGEEGDRMFTRFIEFYKEPSAAGQTDGLRMGANCQGHLGEGNCSNAFMSEDWTIDGVKYKRFAYGRSYDVSQLTNCTMARNNNADPQKPYPFAEGGYHSRNVFVSSQETLYKTKYLNETSFFASGISANDAVSNETQWKSYGGIRWKKQSESTWKYGTWNTTPADIFYNASKGATHFNALLSWWFPKEQVLESQTAASYATEAGIGEKEEYDFCGKTWWYANVPGALGLADGEMNCIIYKKIPYTLKAYDENGNATNFDLEIILRMSLMNGYNHSGDYWIYYGGGYEQVGTVTNVENGTTGNPVDIWTCFDQTKWRSRDELQTVSINNLGEFDFEHDPNYWKAWSGENLADSYTAVRPSYTAYKSKSGGSLGTGECFWSYTSKHWSTTLNQRIRVGYGRMIWNRSSDGEIIMSRSWECRAGLMMRDPGFIREWTGGSDQLRLELAGMV